ncbi:uncharacterized protein LOC117329285 [Pecten maximus]|uniref:uncharacterized protein LOC117329285 n=1 Tax=Pecten maximus TaxID=6579 RepID=UPI001458CBA8|nr:uncharacterized protein LOC117329285 [Pecten maximus]
MAAQTPVPGCSHHSGMGFVYVCKTCDNQLICMDCVVGRHNKHDLGKLTDYVSEQKRQIKEYKERLSKTDIPKAERDIKENNENLSECRKKLREMIDNIKCQAEQMKKEIDKLTDRLVKLCRDLEKMNSDITVMNNSALTKCLREEMRPRLDKYQQVLTSGTNVDVITLARETRNGNCASTVPNARGTLKTAAFKPGSIHNGLLERMLGTVIVDGENPIFRTVKKISVVSKFKTSIRCSVYRTCREGGEAWLSHKTEKQIYRIDQNGNTKKKIECKVKVQSIAVSPTTGRVWFCVQADNSIREVTSNDQIVIRFNGESTPLSLCITAEEMVVVGMSGGIILYTTDGRMVTDGAGRVCRQEADVPHHMAFCTQTGDVAAADNGNVTFGEYMAGKEPVKPPRIIVMDKHLKLKFQYQHIDDIEPQTGEGQHSKFYPYDVCFDGAGDVLVTEHVTSSVLLIDGNNGHFLRTICISDGELPSGISLLDDRILWIGHWNETKIFKYM